MMIRNLECRQFGSGIRDGKTVGTGIQEKHPRFATLIFGVEILKFFDADPGSRIRDGDSSNPSPGSGMA
jgi:hypothetical protein